MITPEILEQHLDAEGIPRQPRAFLVPGLRLPAGLDAGDLIRLTCPNYGRADGWLFRPLDAVIVCDCSTALLQSFTMRMVGQ